MTIETKRIEAQARRAARRAGYTARKSRRAESGYNLGGFMLVDLDFNVVVACSENFNLSPEQVIEFCGEPAEMASREAA